MDEYDENGVEALRDEECWALLRSQRLGRLAYRLADEIDIAPVNHVVDGGTLLFTTAEGSKLLGVVLDPRVAFEVDRLGDGVAESVVVHGRARRLDEDEEHRVETVPLRPSTETLRYNVVEITPTSLSGRRFRLAAG